MAVAGRFLKTQLQIVVTVRQVSDKQNVSYC